MQEITQKTISERLDRIEQRMDELEERIKMLEQDVSFEAFRKGLRLLGYCLTIETNATKEGN